ncbi:MAG TPA: HAD-IA family hydrolase [Vicinamibacterales bacterium]
MALTGHRWVTFDCYGTLVDWQSGFTAALARVAGDAAPALERAYHVWERAIEGEKPHRSYKDVLATALVRAAADIGVPLSAADAAILRQSWGALRLFAGVEPLLAELRGRGWHLAVLTNCDDELFEITHRTFRTPFDLFLTAERVRGYKPAPWHFRAFELLTRVDRREWVHVGCSWYHDIAPARALGVTPVWLDRERAGENPAGAALHVHTEADALEAIECLVARSEQSG